MSPSHSLLSLLSLLRRVRLSGHNQRGKMQHVRAGSTGRSPRLSGYSHVDENGDARPENHTPYQTVV